MHTLGGHQEQNRIRQKVCILVCPVLFAKSMHTRLSRFCGRLRKSAYTSRTPQRQPQQAKSAYTRQPRVSYKKYASMPDAIRQKVHTLGGHPPAVLRAKSVHTRLPSLFQTLPPPPPEHCRHKVYTQASPPGWQTPPPPSGRRYRVERLSRGFWPADASFLPFFALSFGSCVYFFNAPRQATRPDVARPHGLALYAYFFVFVVHIFFSFFFCFLRRCILFRHTFQPFFLVL